jgi:Nucleotidyl transferase
VSSSPTLVVMAAGLGARYGSVKQIESVGPSGEALFDYAVFDAQRAGFTRVVFVIREALREWFDAHLHDFPPDIEARTAVQELHDLPKPFAAPPSRTRPWGTVHAVLSAHVTGNGPVVALNADDFYGREAYDLAMAAARQATASETVTVVGFPVAATLSPHGPVSRAVCETRDGMLTRLEELHGIAQTAEGIVGQTFSGESRRLTGHELVSMNLWVLPAAAIGQLTEAFVRFLSAHGATPDRELPLPDAIGALIAAGTITARVEQARGPWFGLTHPLDRPRVTSSLAAMVERGIYPSPLWASRETD